MLQYPYLIIGGGMAAAAAAAAIRKADPSCEIGILSQEPHPCYYRPALSKNLWMGMPYEAVWDRVENVTYHLNRKAIGINPKTHTVHDQHGTVYWYKKLLLATGSVRKQLDGLAQEHVIYFHSLQDYHRLRALCERGQEFVVIGSGPVAMEISAALCMSGKQVTLMLQEPSLMYHQLPSGFSCFLNAYYTEKGVRLLLDENVVAVTKQGVSIQSGEVIPADGVVVDVGTLPNMELAQMCGLKCDDGIVVDRYLQTSDPDIYAAGDVVNFYAPLLDKRLRWASADGATTMGGVAGLNMMGAHVEYTRLPSSYSELFELHYEALGEVDSSLELFEDWQELYRQGVIYYLKEKRVVGGILWGIRNQLSALHALIASKESISPTSLEGKIKG